MNSKINIFVACAPIVNLKNTDEAMLSKISTQWGIVQDTARKLKIYEIRDPKLDSNIKAFCDKFSPLCTYISAWFSPQSPFADPATIAVQNTLPNSSASTK